MSDPDTRAGSSDENLCEHEKLFNFFKDNSFDVIFSMDKKGRITYISPSVEEISGYKAEEIIGKSFKNFVSKSNLILAVKAFNNLRKGDKIEGLNLVLKRKDGTNSLVELNMAPSIEEGKKFEIIGLFRNITDIQDYDVKLHQSEERLRTLVEMAPDGIITMNLRGTITSVNSAFLNLTGLSEDEAVGRHFTKLRTMRLRDVPKYLKIFGSLMMGKIVDPIEFRYQDKDGNERWGDAHYGLIKTGENKRELLAILREITQRKLDEEKLLASNRELERSNQELDEYTYAVSHDLKAPLRTIEAFSGFLLEDYSENLDEMGRDYLKRMGEASMRMKTLIDDLLLISRVGRKFTEQEFIDLNELLRDIVKDLEIQTEEREAEIIIGDLPTIMTQIVWMRQLFSNLISNGLKFNKSPKPRIEVSCETKENEYLFSVKDNGIGIEKRDREKIFKIFQRLHTQEEYPGTGAGLTICKKIVESNGGRIWVESKVGIGSTFYFTYPKEIEEDSEESEHIPIEHDYHHLQNGLERVILNQPTDQ